MLQNDSAFSAIFLFTLLPAILQQTQLDEDYRFYHYPECGHE